MINYLQKEEERKNLDNEINKKLKQIQSLEDTINHLHAQICDNERELSNTKFELKLLDTYNSLSETGFEYTTNLETSDELEQELISIEQSIGYAIKNNACIKKTKNYYIDNSLTKGEKFQKNYGKNLLIGLNAVYNKHINSRKINVANAEEAINKAYDKYNKQAELLGIFIDTVYKNLLIDAIKAKAKYRQAKIEEQEIIKKEKQKLKEQERLLEELAKEKEKIAKERRYYEATILNCDDNKREEIKSKLAELDKREEDVNYRENNQKAGWLYIAYSPAMPDYVKIGVTRRYQPLIRLQELSSASVPFPFECKGLVFDDDVFNLEAKVHKYLDTYRVNKENRHKEFFDITVDFAIKVLTNEFNCDIIYINENYDN